MASTESSFLSFAKSTLIFFVGTVLSRIMMVLLLPLYTRTLPSADYGYFDVSITYAILLTSFLYFDIWVSVMRFMRENLYGDHPKYVITSGWLIFATSSTLYVLIALAASLIVDLPAIGYIIGYGLFFNATSMMSHIARGWGKNLDFAFSGVLNTVINVGANLVFILVFHLDYRALYLAFILGAGIQCCYLFVRMRMWKDFTRPRAQEVKALCTYSAPLAINSVAYWLLNSLGRVTISQVLSLVANGIYAVGSKFGSTVSLATTCFTYAWQDITFKSKLQDKAFYARGIEEYARFLMLSSAIMLPVISLCFPILVGQAYHAAYPVVPSFLFVAIASAISNFTGNIFYVLKDTKTISYSTLVAAGCNLVLVYPMTHFLGIIGTNLSTLLAFLINILIRCLILKKRIGIVVALRSLTLPLLTMLASYGVYLLGSLVFNVVCALVMGGICLFYYRDRIGQILTMVKERKKTRHG